MKVKIFIESFTNQLEDAINKWLEENPEVEIISMYPYICVLHDLYENYPTQIANQWKESTMTILYKDNTF